MADADVRLEYMEFGVRKREVLRWQRWSWKEVETAFVMVRAKRITEDGEKGGEREGRRGHDFILRFSTKRVCGDRRDRARLLASDLSSFVATLHKLVQSFTERAVPSLLESCRYLCS